MKHVWILHTQTGYGIVDVLSFESNGSAVKEGNAAFENVVNSFDEAGRKEFEEYHKEKSMYYNHSDFHTKAFHLNNFCMDRKIPKSIILFRREVR